MIFKNPRAIKVSALNASLNAMSSLFDVVQLMDDKYLATAMTHTSKAEEREADGFDHEQN